MKNILAILMSFIFVISSVTIAAPSTNAGPNADSGNANMAAASTVDSVGVANANAAAVMAQERVRNASELRNMISESRQVMAQEMEHIAEAKKAIYENQNRVRTAVHALLASENLTGGIGRNVSEIAREFNNSVSITLVAEERIQERNWFMRALFGGDREAALEIANQTEQNTLRIQHLNQLMANCNCTEDVKALMQEQIQSMEQEQDRLRSLAANETSSRGLFGWLLG
jgi:hypothetical protein